jgi:hypothetical protein
MPIPYPYRGGKTKLRRWAARTAAALGLLAIVGAGAGAVLWFTSPIDTFGEIAFDQELTIPPIAPSHIDEDGARVFDLTAATGSHEIAPGERMTGWGFDGPYHVDRIDETVTVDTTEIWAVSNASDDYHNFHIHDAQFQVVEVDGHAPPVELSGWKDTLFIPPAGTVHLAIRFSDYTDPDLPYMYHCHLLHHEDRGMMGQFVVVEPGDAAGDPAGSHAH